MGLLKKYFTIQKNKSNKQINLSVKKRVLEEDGIDLDDILEIKMEDKAKKMLYRNND